MPAVIILQDPYWPKSSDESSAHPTGKAGEALQLERAKIAIELAGEAAWNTRRRTHTPPKLTHPLVGDYGHVPPIVLSRTGLERFKCLVVSSVGGLLSICFFKSYLYTNTDTKLTNSWRRSCYKLDRSLSAHSLQTLSLFHLFFFS